MFAACSTSLLQVTTSIVSVGLGMIRITDNKKQSLLSSQCLHGHMDVTWP
jgi:hypothetical protein